MTPPATSVPSIDTPPAQPATSPYQLSVLDIYPVVKAQPAGTIADTSQPSKMWSRPLQPGENPATFKLFDTWSNAGGTWSFVPQSLALTLGAAAAVNVSAGLPQPGPNPTAAQSTIFTFSVPAPARNLAANEQLAPQLMGAPLCYSDRRRCLWRGRESRRIRPKCGNWRARTKFSRTSNCRRYKPPG